MLTPNRIYVIFIVFMVMCCVSQSFRLHTEESLTAMRGGHFSLPCDFSVPVDAVYWYKHNFTGAPDDGASLVARDYRGFTDPVPGFERFSITKDYSLVIRNITVHDETTYSCLVVPKTSVDERRYTDLRVVALAEPLEPTIESCKVEAPGSCLYTVDENSPEDVTLVCMVYNVRPPPDLTWIRSDGIVQEDAIHQTQEKNGLFNISSQLQVSESYFEYICLANGEAVEGISITIITFEDHFTTVSHDRRINGGLITSIVFNVILLILLVSCLTCFKKCRFQGPSGGKEDTLMADHIQRDDQWEAEKDIIPVILMQMLLLCLMVESKLQKEMKVICDSILRKNYPLDPENELETQSNAELISKRINQVVEALESKGEKAQAVYEEEIKSYRDVQSAYDQTVEELETGGETNDCRTWEILIRSFNGGMFPLQVDPKMTVDHLISKISARIHLAPSQMYITCDNRELRGPCNLKTAGINNLSIINVYGRLRGG